MQLASIVHDLKTPLYCIQGTISIVSSLLQDDNTVLTQYLAKINTSFDFIFSMIEDIQDLAQFNNNQHFSINNETVPVRPFLNEVGALFEEQCAFKNIQLLLNITQAVPDVIYTDPKRLKQVLMNLLSNALKFTQKGHIALRVDMLKEFKITELDTEHKFLKKKMKLQIEDTGMGIKTADLKKLFKYFGKLKDSLNLNKKGTGLGLNITKRIVESMGGDIQVESEEGKGTKFSFTLLVGVKNTNFNTGSSAGEA